tara:strand:- start:357 stop:737 length:381 start_codon:yes stop_codon:yes gene_type:complete
MRLHHLGIATKDVERAKQFIHQSHTVTCEEGPIWDPNLNANISIFKVEEGAAIELVSGPIVENILKKGINLYHYCYEVENIETKIKELKNSGGVLILKPTPAIIFDQRLVAFLLTPIGMIELLNKN